MEEKQITCKACEMHDYTGDDLDPSFHEGFTVGKGKVMYWYFIWHGLSGNATVVTPEIPAKRRYIKGDQLITVHFKP